MDNSEITHIIIHCAATPNGRPHDIKDIDKWHEERGFGRAATFYQERKQELKQPWNVYLINQELMEKKSGFNPKHCGYHYLIRLDGVVELGRHIGENGAHARGWNHRSVGICMVGTNQFTREQWTVLPIVIRTLKKMALSRGWGPNGVQVIGHRQINPGKTCPGFDVPAWIEGVGLARQEPKPWPDGALFETQMEPDDTISDDPS